MGLRRDLDRELNETRNKEKSRRGSVHNSTDNINQKFNFSDTDSVLPQLPESISDLDDENYSIPSLLNSSSVNDSNNEQNKRGLKKKQSYGSSLCLIREEFGDFETNNDE